MLNSVCSFWCRCSFRIVSTWIAFWWTRSRFSFPAMLIKQQSGTDANSCKNEETLGDVWRSQRQVWVLFPLPGNSKHSFKLQEQDPDARWSRALRFGHRGCAHQPSMDPPQQSSELCVCAIHSCNSGCRCASCLFDLWFKLNWKYIGTGFKPYLHFVQKINLLSPRSNNYSKQQQRSNLGNSRLNIWICLLLINSPYIGLSSSQGGWSNSIKVH